MHYSTHLEVRGVSSDPHVLGIKSGSRLSGKSLSLLSQLYWPSYLIHIATLQDIILDKEMF